ncbi:ASPIC/UnbV domain-containing protein [Luteitalea sp.]|uniref:ASPIC/UnbV domain-containing protein n=1 Tax=Luteitalea sp. TaxID=2004800 RepID=UPI0037C7D759
MTCNRDAIGARISWSVGGKVTRRFKTGGGSYLSAHDPREILGLGTATQVDWVEIAWPAPSTRVDRLTTVKVDAYQKVVEGQGIV